MYLRRTIARYLAQRAWKAYDAYMSKPAGAWRYETANALREAAQQASRAELATIRTHA